MTKNKKQKSSGVGKALAITAAAAAVAAGAYYFFGPNAKKHQKKMKGWMLKMKSEVVEKLEEAKEVSEPVYDAIVDKVAASYAQAGKAKDEVTELAKMLKKDWKGISGSVKKAGKHVVSQAKKAKNKLSK